MGEKVEIIKNRHGGARPGAGQPKKKATEHALYIMKKAIKELYNKDTDEESQVAFLKDFAQTPRGQQFVAEHLFGKAPQVIENPDGVIVQQPTIIFK